MLQLGQKAFAGATGASHFELGQVFGIAYIF